MNETFKHLSSILRELATAAASGCAYETWKDDFARKECRRVWADENAVLRKARNVRFTSKDILAMSDEELNTLGFGQWDESGLRLIPLWAFNYIADGETLAAIDGDTAVKGTEEIDLDVRFGCIPYGFMPS